MNRNNYSSTKIGTFFEPATQNLLDAWLVVFRDRMKWIATSVTRFYQCLAIYKNEYLPNNIIIGPSTHKLTF